PLIKAALNLRVGAGFDVYLYSSFSLEYKTIICGHITFYYQSVTTAYGYYQKKIILRVIPYSDSNAGKNMS
ncbi:MAG: hypothetical protein Q4E29_01765, partial [Lachnospiraceae bacterium]|nr:hypothetical protein [Lachnospiraceae bacterium]